MPEGPEVQVVIDELKNILIKEKIKTINISQNNSSPIKNDINPVLNQTITDIKRHGKYIDIVLDNKNHLIIHLGMTGYFRTQKPEKYIFFIQTEKLTLYYCDPRKFGTVQYYSDLNNINSVKMLGPDGICSSENEIYSRLQKDKNKKMTIKPYLLEGKNIAGIGNIYASEILFDAGVRPDRKMNTLTDKEIKKIAYFIKDVLNKAYTMGGSTIKSFTHVEGTQGSYQNCHRVYHRNICPKCGGPITQIIQNGRSSFYCPIDQK